MDFDPLNSSSKPFNFGIASRLPMTLRYNCLFFLFCASIAFICVREPPELEIEKEKSKELEFEKV